MRPPIAEKQPSVSKLHGEVRTDAFAWLKDTSEVKNPKILSYLDEENAYTDHQMKDMTSLREQLYAEMLSRVREDDEAVPYKKGNYDYYSVTEKGKEYPIYLRKKVDSNSRPEVVLDLNTLATGKEFISLGLIKVSPDGRTLAYGLDFDGSRHYDIFFKDLATGAQLDFIPAMSDEFAWANDSRTLFYASYSESMRPNRIYRHKIGTSYEADQMIFQESDEKFDVSIERVRSGGYILLSSASKSTTEVWFIDADHPDASPQVIEPRRAGHSYYVDHRLNHFFIRTNDRAPLFKVVMAPVSSPGLANWLPFFPEQSHVPIEDINVFEDFVVLSVREAGLTELKVLDFRNLTKQKNIRFPDLTYTVSVGDNAEFSTPFLRVDYQTLGRPESVLDFDIRTQQLRLQKQMPVPEFNADDYQTDRIFAKAADGKMIPISLVYKKGFKRDGSHPFVLVGYGAYGVPYDPLFSQSLISLLSRGFAYGIAHVRGGGEYGDPWYFDGKLFNKKNSFTDFVTCAEYLIEQGYTQAKKLAIHGRSAGGLLVTAAMNLRPDLFKSVIAGVPFVDVMNTMLDETLPLTVAEYEEWGNPNDREAYRYIQSYAPYENIQKADYPNLLLMTGIHDNRVPYWEPTKFAAKLRAEKTDSNLVLLNAGMDAGHGEPSGRYTQLRERAFIYAFLLKTLGMAEAD